MTKTIRPPSTLSAFLHYVSLNMLAMLGTSCYILADTFFVANGIGEDGLTALNLVLPLFNLMNATAEQRSMPFTRQEANRKPAAKSFSMPCCLPEWQVWVSCWLGFWVLTQSVAGWGAMQRPMI